MTCMEAFFLLSISAAVVCFVLFVLAAIGEWIWGE